MWYRKLLLLVCATLVTSAWAGTYTVGAESTSYAPYYTTQGGNWTGYAREVLDAFAKESGHTFVYKPRPVKRLLGEFVEGKLDFKFPDNPYWGQDAKKGNGVVYSEPVAPYVDGVLVRPDRKGAGKDQLKTLGTVLGFTAWDYLGDIKSGAIRLRENTNMTSLLKMALAGKVDGVYANPAVVRYQLRKMGEGEDALVLDADLPHTRSAYHLSTIRHPEVIDQFNQFLKSKADWIAQLQAKYGIR